MRIHTLALVAMIATIGLGSAYWGGYYPDAYNYDMNYDNWVLTYYSPGAWHDNEYSSWVRSVPVVDRWGYEYGYAHMDTNGANPYWGYNDWSGSWWVGYPGWPFYGFEY